MIKILFFDNLGLETLSGFKRRLEHPVKHPANPLFIADRPWETGNMQLYGSVVKAPDRPFQLWYSVIQKPWNMCLCYAESDDGLTWRKPLLDLVRYRGRKTNILMDCHVNGPAVLFDQDTGLYRMLAGTLPSKCICAYQSSDGIHWKPMNQGPVIANKPDCPIGLVRQANGQYAAYHRHPVFIRGGRRVCRSTSWDFRFWAPQPELVFEPDKSDPMHLQFYGMGSCLYGQYELGTVWIYRTDSTDLAGGHMVGSQEPELTYARSGYAWHRAMQGEAFIPRGGSRDWDRGNLQCASQPIFLEDEIRYYYAGTQMLHKSHWELEPQRAGLGMASLKPDRFMALEAGASGGEVLTTFFELPRGDLFVNAAVAKGGKMLCELVKRDGSPIQALTADRCLPITGDSLAHRLRWRDVPAGAPIADGPVRLRVRGSRCKLYSFYALNPDEKPVYHKFTNPY